MKTKTVSTRQKGRRSLQGRKANPGRLGKRPIRIPRTGGKQDAGDAQRRHAGP